MRATWKATGIALATLAAVAATSGSAAAYAGSGGVRTCTGTGPQATAGSGTGQGPGLGTGMGRGMGQGQRDMGRGMGQGMGQGQRGTGAGWANAGSGTLTSDQRAVLAGMAEEEKLAHDVYASLAASYPGIVQFDRVAGAELQHLATVRVLLDRYGVADPTAGLGAGEFADPDVAADYGSLLDRATTPARALGVGLEIEKADIADLDEAMAGLTAPDVRQAYAHLHAASERHLAAFGG